MSDRILTCQAIDEILPDHLEGELDAASHADVEAHVASCARCAALIADLRRVSAQARSLPDLAPSRDLWSDIASRIEAPVISLPATRDRGTRRFGAAWMAIAAALLVLASSGITYVVTKGSMERAPADVADIPRPVGPVEAALPARPDSAEPASSQRLASDTQKTPDSPRSPRETQSNARNVSGSSDAESLSAYDREIMRLRAVVELRRADMDPATVAIVEQNLRLIDAAIAQSRDALDRDPASRFLNEQLDHALAKKVDLLRTVALLPSRS